MKNLILSLVALMAFNSQVHAAGAVQSDELKKIVTQSVASDGDTYLTNLSEQESEASRIANATVAPNLETETRPKIWDARFFGRR
jgi:hypothetical protein